MSKKMKNKFKCKDKHEILVMTYGACKHAIVTTLSLKQYQKLPSISVLSTKISNIERDFQLVFDTKEIQNFAVREIR